MYDYNNLPSHLLPHILQYLTTTELLYTIRLINKTWSQYTTHIQCWQYNTLILNNTGNDTLMLQYLQQHINTQLYGLHIKRTLNLNLIIRLCDLYPNLQYLRISTPMACDFRDWTVTDDDTFFLQQLKQLQYIDIDCCWSLTDTGINYICHCRNLRTLVLRSPSQLTDLSLQYIAELKQLHTLKLLLTSAGLDNSQFTADGFKALTTLKLNTLTIWNCYCSDNMLLYIGQISTLQHLDLDGCENLCGSAYQYVTSLKLMSLSVSRSKLTDDALLYIGQITTLQRLKLIQNSKLTDDGIKYLTQLSNLISLNILRNTALTDESIKHISTLTNITALDISGCSLLTDIACTYLADMINLTSLHMLACTLITEHAVNTLQTNLPQLTKLRHKSTTHSNQITVHNINTPIT